MVEPFCFFSFASRLREIWTGCLRNLTELLHLLFWDQGNLPPTETADPRTILHQLFIMFIISEFKNFPSFSRCIIMFFTCHQFEQLSSVVINFHHSSPIIFITWHSHVIIFRNFHHTSSMFVFHQYQNSKSCLSLFINLYHSSYFGRSRSCRSS